jgi:hypothetical protein
VRAFVVRAVGRLGGAGVAWKGPASLARAPGRPARRTGVQGVIDAVPLQLLLVAASVTVKA